MFEIVTVIKECPRVIFKAHKYLYLFARHDQHGILPAIIYKTSA